VRGKEGWGAKSCYMLWALFDRNYQNLLQTIKNPMEWPTILFCLNLTRNKSLYMGGIYCCKPTRENLHTLKIFCIFLKKKQKENYNDFLFLLNSTRGTSTKVLRKYHLWFKGRSNEIEKQLFFLDSEKTGKQIDSLFYWDSI